MLKLDPKNTELLAQKQTVLKQNIQATTEKLKNLKTAQDLYIKSGGNLNSPEYRNLQREIISTENSLKQLNLENSKWTQTSQKLSEVSSKMKALGETVTNVGKKVSILSAAVAGLFGAGIKYNADIETSTKAFETFLGTAEEATKAIDEIKKQSNTSPFDTKELIKANQYLITTGESADDSRKTISALADAIALTGGGNDELNRMASNLQQIKNAGKATSMDIKQFAYAGIDVYGILSETTGKNVEQLKKMDITYDELSKAFIKASSEGGKYYNGQVKMTETLNGQVSKLKKTFQDLLGELSSTLMPILKKITDRLQGVVNWFKNLDQKQKDMITKIGLAIVAIGPALIILGKLISFGGTVIGVIAKISGLIAGLKVGTGALAGAMTVLTGPVGAVIAAVIAAAAAFALLWNKSETFRDSIKKIGQTIANTYNTHIKPAIGMLIDTLKTWWNDVLQPLLKFLSDTFSPIIEKIFVFIGKYIAGVFENIGIVIETAVNAFKGFIDFIAGVFTGDWKRAWQGISNIFTSIFNGLKQIFKNVINFYIDNINGLIRGINNVKAPDWVPGIGGKGINIPLIPRLAKGGIVDKATLAMIGEGKSAEAVIPLDRTLTKYMAEAMKQAGGTNSIVVNFYPQQMTEAELDKAFNYIDRRFGLIY